MKRSANRSNPPASVLSQRIAQVMLSKKAQDVLILDLQALGHFADYFVLCTGTSDRHVLSVHEHIAQSLAQECGEKPYQVEGLIEGEWVLLDYVSVVVHIFLEDTRTRYNLEGLWGDVPSQRLTESLENNIDD